MKGFKGYDKKKKVNTNRAATIVENVRNIISFVCVKWLLEPMQALATCLECKLAKSTLFLRRLKTWFMFSNYILFLKRNGGQ